MKLEIFKFEDFRNFLISKFRQSAIKENVKLDTRRDLPFWRYLRLVIEGRIFLSQPAIEVLAKKLTLKPIEVRYFIALVKYNQTGKSRYLRKMSEIRKEYRKLQPTETSEIILYMDSI